MGTRTRTFIGSSTEGLAVARAIEAHLLEVTDAVVWTDGVFLPGRTFVETLEKLLEEVDYAVLVASPDDLLLKRDIESFSMRDNVLLELGLFMAKLGRQRTYLVTPQDHSIHIPTDLLGVKTVSYDLPSGAPSPAVVQALQEACRTIRRAMQESEKELSNAMRRLLIKRLLTWTTKVHELMTVVQAESVRSLLDRTQFDRMRQEAGSRLALLLDEQREDVARLRVAEQYERLKTTLTAAIEALPFPQEAVVSKNELAGGLLSHFVGGASLQDQLRKRMDLLAARYEAWWNNYRSQVARDLGQLQSELIRQL